MLSVPPHQHWQHWNAPWYQSWTSSGGNLLASYTSALTAQQQINPFANMLQSASTEVPIDGDAQ